MPPPHILYYLSEKAGCVLQKDHRSFLYNAAVLSASNLGLQGLGFVYRIFLSRLAGAEGLGVYHLAFSIYTVINAACLSGLTMAGARLSAELEAQGRAGAVGWMVRRAFMTFMVFFAVCAAVLIPGRDWIAVHLLGDARTAPVFPIMLCCLALTGVENIFKSIAIGRNQVHLAAGAELTEQIVRIAAVLLLLYGFSNGDYGRIACLIFLGMTVSELVSAVLLTRLYHRHLKSPRALRQTPPKGLLREFAGVVLPVSAAALVNNLIGSASSVILPGRLMQAGLSHTRALEELGIVSGMAMPMLILPIALISSVCTVLMPEIGRSRMRGDQGRIAALSRKAISITGLLGIPVTAALVPLAPTLSRLFFGQPLALHYVALLGVSTVLCYYQMVTAGLLNGLGAQRFTVFTSIAGEVVQLALVWVLAAQPGLAIDGYILAQCIAPALTVTLNLVQLCRLVPLAADLPRLFAVPLLCGVTVFFWVRVFYAFFIGAVGSQWLGVLCAGAGAALLCAGLLRLLGVRLRDYITRPSRSAFLWSFY